MIKRIIALILLSVFVACNSEKEPKAFQWIGIYSNVVNETSIFLSLHSLDGVEDILQADVMIHHTDGSGSSFEVQNASVENIGNKLIFKWVDGFGNSGSAEVKPLLKNSKPDTDRSSNTNGNGKDSRDPTKVHPDPPVNEINTTERKVAEDKETREVLFSLKVDEVVNERNMMFIDEYTLTKISANDTGLPTEPRTDTDTDTTER